MSGPYCKDCGWWHVAPFSHGEMGECFDPAKVISDRGGQTVNAKPLTHESYTCSQWTVSRGGAG